MKRARPLVEIRDCDRNLLTCQTSGLSLELSSGRLDPRDVLREINGCLARRKLTAGQTAYLEGIKRQIVFREFARSALEVQTFKFPKGAKGERSREYKRLFAADTGIPIVDACVTALKGGLPHNRARLLLARYAIRNANLDPELVARFFKDNLRDYSPVVNTFNIVSAASGAVFGEPWFRLSNPLAAAKKLDPSGEFLCSYGFEKENPEPELLNEIRLGSGFWKQRWQKARETGRYHRKSLWPTRDRDRGIYFILDKIPARGAFTPYYRRYLQNEDRLL